MKYKVTNPQGGADIIGAKPNGEEMNLLVGETIEVEKDAADYFRKTWGFLEVSELSDVSTEGEVTVEEPVVAPATGEAAVPDVESSEEKKARVKAEKAALKAEKAPEKAAE